jgi:valine dehydrogenase (NAD+)
LPEKYWQNGRIWRNVVTDSGFRDPWDGFQGHEQVIVAADEETGLRAVVAIHSTALGPALGGTRMASYADAAEPMMAAYSDALRLARAMSLKNALAGLPHGGGKAVIIGDPATKTPELLRAYGRFLQSLGGRYITAGDVGMQVEDMDLIGEECEWTTGRSVAKGGVGDSGQLTAVGIHLGMQAAANHVWGDASLAGKRVGVVGAGKVGGRLARHLLDDGATVFIFDPSPQAQQWVAENTPEAHLVSDLPELLAQGLDVLSPNAMGGLITMDLAEHLDVALICGGANNQLATPEVGDALHAKGITYAPDFLVNCGGVIQVAEERNGADMDRASARVARVFDTTSTVLQRAAAEGVTPVIAAEEEALERISAGR